MAEYNAGTVKATMTADGKGYHATVDGIKKKDQELKQSAKEVKTSYIELGIAAGASFAAITAGIWKATAANNDFNKSMANVGTLLPGNITKLQQYKKELQDMSLEVRRGTDDLSDGLYMLISAFGDTDDSIEKLKINAKAAAAGVAGTKDAILLTSAVTKAYGDISAEATQKAADLAFITLKLGQTTFPELAHSIGMVAPLAAQLNMEQEEMWNIFATLTGVTGDTAKVATQAAAILRAFIKPTTEMSDAIKELGYDSASALLDERGLVGALEAVISRTDESEEAVAKLFGRAEALTAVFSLVGAQSDTFAKKLEQVKVASGTADEAFREQIEGINELGDAMERASLLTTQISELYGEALEPTVSAVVTAYSSLLANVRDFVAVNPAMVSGATAGAFAFTGLATAMAGASALIPKLVTGFQALFIKSGPVGWGILAISALTAAFVGLHTAQQKQLQQMKEQAKEFNQQSREIHDLTSEYKELSTKTEKTADEKERLKQITERLIELSPGIVKGYDGEGNAILDLNIALEAMVDKKREALELDAKLLEADIKKAQQEKRKLEMQRRTEFSMVHGIRVIEEDPELEAEIAAQQQKIDELIDKRTTLLGIIQGTTVESVRAEYERQKAEEEAVRKAEESARKREENKQRQQALAKEREELEAELADRIYELMHNETEVKIRELEKRREAYEKEGVAEIEVEGQKFTLAQWYEMEKTRILDEEAEKRKAIEQELLDWQNQARMVAMDDFEKQITRYELDRDTALEAARTKFQDIEQLRQAEAAINQYYDHLINEARVTEFEAMIREQYKLEQQLTEWEREELLKRLQAELTVLEATTGASEERIQALKNVIKELGEEDIPTLADMTKKWNEDLVEGLSRAIAYGESLTDIFDNLLRTIAQYYLQQAIMGGLKKAGLSFHDGGKVGRFHWGGAVDAFAGAIRAHGGLKLAADEVPIIAQTGERVLSRAENAAYEAGWKPQVDIQIINNTGTPIEARRETEFDGPRTVVRFFLEGYSRNIDGIQRILQPR